MLRTSPWTHGSGVELVNILLQTPRHVFFLTRPEETETQHSEEVGCASFRTQGNPKFCLKHVICLENRTVTDW
jgi:hypothetical protein